MANEKELNLNPIKEWGICDFRCPEEYPANFKKVNQKTFSFELEKKFNSLPQLESLAWRWEFLRRSPEYRQYWKKFGKKKYFKPWYHPAFGMLGYLPHPKERFSKKIIFQRLVGGTYGARHQLWRVIDLSQRLNPQLEAIEVEAKLAQERLEDGKDLLGVNTDRQRQRRRHDQKTWRTMLRVLDAREVNASYKRIAKEIGKNGDYDVLSKQGSRLYQQAVSCRNQVGQVWYPMRKGDEMPEPVYRGVIDENEDKEIGFWLLFWASLSVWSDGMKDFNGNFV